MDSSTTRIQLFAINTTTVFTVIPTFMIVLLLLFSTKLKEPASERSRLHPSQENARRRRRRLTLKALSAPREKPLDQMEFHWLILHSPTQHPAESTLFVNFQQHLRSWVAPMVLSLIISTTNVSTQRMDLKIVNVGTPVLRNHSVPTVATLIVLVLEHTV